MPKYLFLEKDLQTLTELVQEKIKEYQHYQNEMSVAADQTNETWHDNFGFEDSNRQLHRIGQEIEDLAKIIERAEVISDPVQFETIAIGHEITYEILGRERSLRIGSFINLGPKSISYESPLVKNLLGKKVGQTLPWNGQTLTILKIQ